MVRKRNSKDKIISKDDFDELDCQGILVEASKDKYNFMCDAFSKSAQHVIKSERRIE